MSVIRCPKGHYYDDQRFFCCLHCGITAGVRGSEGEAKQLHLGDKISMGARGRIIGLALCMAVSGAGLALAGETAGAHSGTQTIIEEQDRRIEQVYLNMPEISVYGTGFTPEDVRSGAGYLSQDKLDLIDVSVFSDSGEGICYYVLLDISGSIPRSYFEPIKDGIQILQESLGENDKMVLCTFGESVALVADGEQTSGEMASILEGLKNQDQKTLLFEGIDRVAALSVQSKAKDGCRSILMVISDGEDIAVGRKLAQEAQNTLKEKGIPAYAFCIKNTATANINNFGEFARSSGGFLVTFTPDEAVQMLGDLAQDLQDDIRIRYQAAANIVTNKAEQFSLKFEDGSVLTREVMNVHWIPDTEPPYLVSGEAAGSRQLRVTFSEPVDGLDDAANYQVTLDGREIGVIGVSFDKQNGTIVSLSLDEPIQNGTYRISCANITDRSMEKNLVAGSLTAEIVNIRNTEPKPPETEASDYTGVLFLIFMAVAALCIIVLVKVKKKPFEQKKKAAGEPENKEAVMEGNEFEQHGKILPKAKTMCLNVIISMNGKQSKQTEWKIETSLIVGRSSICDVYFDDPEMSRRHFSLETGADGLYITDLNSMNGTSVNGIRIRGKRKLESGAVIEAGSMKMTVRW